MQTANNFIVLNIREYLDSTDKRLGEEKLTELLSGFFCPLNPDVERFLKHQAIEFTKKTSGSYIFGVIARRCRIIRLFLNHDQAAWCKGKTL